MALSPENRAVNRAADRDDERRIETPRHGVKRGGYRRKGVDHRGSSIADLDRRRTGGRCHENAQDAARAGVDGRRGRNVLKVL